MSDRGGKVEALHTVEANFANINMNPQTAQMLIEEGIVRFAARHVATLKYQRGERKSPIADHFRPWMRREANILARACDMRVPYPDEPELSDDNSERFLSDYYYEQEHRKLTYAYSEGMTRCPCTSCAERRETCPCVSCQSFRLEPASVDDVPLATWLDTNRVVASEKLLAASVELRRPRLADDDDIRRSRRLEQLSRFISGGHYAQFLEYYGRQYQQGPSFRNFTCSLTCSLT
jgi:hypothetical protein